MGMKTLIAVKSCHSDMDQGCHGTILETWGKDIDLRFFIGCERPTYSNLTYDCFHEKTIDLDVHDDYDHLPQKTQAICRWFVNSDYEYIFLCDVDTFLLPSKLLKIGYEDYDYSGRFGTAHPMGKPFLYKDGRGMRHPKCYTWASGGFGYFLSKDAAKLIAASIPNTWAEDMWVGDCLGEKIANGEITAADLQNFENVASWHYPAHRLGWNRPRMQLWMRDMHGLYNDPNHEWKQI